MKTFWLYLGAFALLAGCSSPELYACDYTITGASGETTDEVTFHVCSKEDLQVGTVGTMDLLMVAVDCDGIDPSNTQETVSCDAQTCVPLNTPCEEAGTATRVEQ